MSNKVREALRLQVLSWIPASVVGKVTAVQAPDTCTVEPIDGGAEYFKVRLRGTIDGSDDGTYAEPKIDSYVIISPLMNDEGQMWVSRFTEVEKWHIKTDGGAKVEVLANGEVHLNGNSHNGLVKLQQLQANLDDIKSYVEAMNAAIGPAFAAVGAAMSANGAAGQSSYTGAMAGQSITLQNMENTKVKHGS